MNYSRPRLKAGADLQLHNAFNEGNWPVVIRLAEKRASTLKDQYYQIVKLAAECLTEDLVVKFSAVEGIWKLVQDGTVLKEVESLELLEWAAKGLVPAEEFPQIFGPLRVRTAKASAKDGSISRMCLEACILHWDLASAQQIAALMDRTFQQERKFMFWNIVITHMLSMSPQTPQDKKKLYGMLAQKQVERAAQTTEQATDASEAKPLRGIQSEEEVILLYNIVATHGTAQDFEKLTSSSVFSPLAQLRLGRKEPLFRTLKNFSDSESWEALFNVCHTCLSMKNQDGKPDLSASDWTVWRHYTAAAKHLKLTDPSVGETVDRLLSELLEATANRRFYRRTISLARLHLTFALYEPDGDDATSDTPSSRRLKQLVQYLDDQATQPTCFDDVKSLVEDLDHSALQYLTRTYKPKSMDEAKPSDKLLMKLLRVKLHYLALTNSRSYAHVSGARNKIQCHLCGSETLYPCRDCCKTIAQTSKDIIAAANSDHDDSSTVIECKIILTHVLLAAGLPPRHTSASNLSPNAVKTIIKTWTLVESELSNSPANTQLNLLSTLLSVRLGVPRLGYARWSVLDVKRTIFDSLAPLLYDRLSTLDPTIMRDMTSPDWDMLEQLSHAYNPYVDLPLPKRLLDAFGEASYNSAMVIPTYLQDLRHSCTRAMSLVEESRVERIRGRSLTNLSNDKRLVDVTDDVQLKEVIDHGSFPSLGSSDVLPPHKLLAIGPAPSNGRSHLSLLAEHFHDTLTVILPPGYKSSASSVAVDQAYILESMTRLSNSFGKWLIGAPQFCTPPELTYFRTLHLLASLVSLILAFDRSTPLPSDLMILFTAVKEGLEALIATLDDGTGNAVAHTVGSLTNLHNLAMIQFTATATKQAAQFLLTTNNRAREKDPSGQSGLPKEIAAQTQVLLKAGQQALQDGKAALARLRSEVHGQDFQRRLTAWLEEEEADDEVHSGVPVDKACVSELVMGWRKTIEAWGVVKWE